MRDASEHAPGYVLLIEDYTNEETGEVCQFAPVPFSSKRLTTGQMPSTMYAKKFFTMHAFSLY